MATVRTIREILEHAKSSDSETMIAETWFIIEVLEDLLAARERISNFEATVAGLADVEFGKLFEILGLKIVDSEGNEIPPLARAQAAAEFVPLIIRETVRKG